MKNKNFNIPNLLSISRILFLPVLYIFMFREKHLAFLVSYIVLGSTDFLDGYLARRLNQVTALGKALDTIADVIFYFSTAYFILVLFPEYLAPNFVMLMFFLVIYIFAYVLSLFYFKKPVQIHTSLLRFCATLVYLLVIMSYMFNTTYLITAILVLFMIGFIEEIWIFIRFGKVDIDTKSIIILYRDEKRLNQ
jgi:phosphatidylglycerophosphate synthase